MKAKKEWRKGLFAFLRPGVRMVARLVFGASTDTYRKLKGPYLVLSNHSCFADAMLVSVAFREPLHIVASANAINGSAVGRMLMAVGDPIVIKKTTMDLQAIRRMLSEAKQGHSICLFPEGTITIDGRPTHVDVSVAKLARQLKLPIVLYRIEGGYFRKPKWARHKRRNRVYGRVVEIISPEEAADMPLQTLYERIMSVIGYDPFAQPFDIPTPPVRRLADGIERLVYYCPTCQAKGDFTTKGNTFRCAHCGTTYTIDEQCRITPGPANTAEWNEWQTQLAEARVDAEDFAIEGELWDVMQRQVVAKGTLSVLAEGIALAERTIPYAEMDGVALYAHNQILLTTGGVDYRFEPIDDHANVLTLIAAIRYRLAHKNE